MKDNKNNKLQGFNLVIEILYNGMKRLELKKIEQNEKKVLGFTNFESEHCEENLINTRQ